MSLASPERQSLERVTLRAAVPRDLDFLRSLCRDLFLQYGSYDRYVESWFAEDFVSTIVAEWDGEPSGLAMLALAPKRAGEPRPVAELLAIAVAPKAQSRGIGRALLERSERLALDSSPEIRDMRLSVAEGNSRAQRMFFRHGFRTESDAGVYPAGQRAVFMIKRLKEESAP